MDISSPITGVKGVGAKTEQLFQKQEYTPWVIYSFVSARICEISGSR